jgi:hypothetical protein
MKRLFSIALWLVTLVLLPAAAQAQIQWRISIKVFLSSGGVWPSQSLGYGTNGVNMNSAAVITSNINVTANRLLANHGRGYQFQLTEVVTLSGLSQWYSLDFRSQVNKENLEAAATANATAKATYAWRDNAINVYINDTSSGYCSSPGNGSLITVGAQAYDTLIIHECGHYFSLAHTHSGQDYRNANNTDCAAANCNCALLIGGTTDGIDDTIADHQCWDAPDQIAQGNYGQNYASLSAGNKTRVDRVLLNIMSYHSGLTLFTSDQLDAMADASNSSRFGVATGRTRFVDRANSSGIYVGTSGLPYRTLATGLSAATSTGSDIVLIRPGNYNEPQTITKAVTLRATRGNAVIGLP